jgi:AcrR family transcriptional regulator
MEPGLRERKKLATRQALALAALRLSVERGFDGVLVEDIAAEVGVSPRTFNNYFSSKAEAICALAVDRAQRAGEALRLRPPGEPLRMAIEATMRTEFADGAVPAQVPDRMWFAGLRMVLSTPAMQGEYLRVRAAMQESLSSAIADRLGAPSSSLLPDVIGGAVAAACDTATHRWIHADPPVPLLPLVQEGLRHLAEY